MDTSLDIPTLLALRKLTTAISRYFERHLNEHLTNLTPLLDPKSLLGGHIRGVTTRSVKNADQAFQEIRKLYQPIATAKPFSLPADLSSPVDVFGVTPAITTADYEYELQSNGESKNIKVTRPLRWVLTYKGLEPGRLRDLIATQSSGHTTDLTVCVLHYLAMHLIQKKRTGAAPILSALRFPPKSVEVPEFGGLPLVYISCPISTTRPPDQVILESTEISGTNAFEEVVDLGDIRSMQDPLKAEVLGIVEEQNTDLLAQVSG